MMCWRPTWWRWQDWGTHPTSRTPRSMWATRNATTSSTTSRPRHLGLLHLFNVIVWGGLHGTGVPPHRRRHRHRARAAHLHLHPIVRTTHQVGVQQRRCRWFNRVGAAVTTTARGAVWATWQQLPGGGCAFKPSARCQRLTGWAGRYRRNMRSPAPSTTQHSGAQSRCSIRVWHQHP